MQPLISDAVKESLVQQISNELGNSNFYMRVSAFLQSKNLKNLAKHFEGQILEEQEHSRIIYKLLTDLGVDFHIPEVNSVDVDFNSFREIAETYLAREISTTNSLKDIRNMASEQGDGGCPVVEVAMIEMIKLQQAELEESTSMLDSANLFNDWWQVAIWDNSLGD
jgi:ferritin